jgi:hypothetical protein
MKNSCDVFAAAFGELLYEIHGMFTGYRSMACNVCYFASELYYCDLCQNSKQCFGSVGLKRAEFCILNKEYSKLQYERLAGKVAAHMVSTSEWGEFLQPGNSPFGYNETQAVDYYPLKREQAIRLGYRWSDYEIPSAQTSQCYDAVMMKELPEAIDEIADSISQSVLSCLSCGKPYQIQSAELSFYRRIKLAIPRRCPLCRYQARLESLNPRQLWRRRCAVCGSELLTSFAPERQVSVVCERCYVKGLS